MWETQLLIFIYKDTKQPYVCLELQQQLKKHSLWVENHNVRIRLAQLNFLIMNNTVTHFIPDADYYYDLSQHEHL